MLEPSRKEVAVGNSTDEINEYQTNEQQVAAKKASSTISSTVPVANANFKAPATGVAASASPPAYAEASQPLKAVTMIGTRNNSEQTRYQVMTQQFIAESAKSTLPMLERQQRTEGKSGGGDSPATTQRNKREFVEMLGRQGISAVKKLTNQIFRAYGYVGMFSEEYDQVLAAQVADSNSTTNNSISNTYNAASAILKPIEDLAEQRRQIFKHERLAPKQPLPNPGTAALLSNQTTQQL